MIVKFDQKLYKYKFTTTTSQFFLRFAFPSVNDKQQNLHTLTGFKNDTLLTQSTLISGIHTIISPNCVNFEGQQYIMININQIENYYHISSSNLKKGSFIVPMISNIQSVNILESDALEVNTIQINNNRELK